jgi:hypothetical protein
MKQLDITPEQVQALQAGVKAEGKSIGENTQSLRILRSFDELINNNAGRLETLLAKLPDQGSTLANKPLRSLAASFGSEDQAEFNGVLEWFNSEAGRIIGGHPKLLGSPTDTKNERMREVMNPGFTVGQFRRMIERTKFEMSVRQQGFANALTESSNAMTGFGMPGSRQFDVPLGTGIDPSQGGLGMPGQQQGGGWFIEEE